MFKKTAILTVLMALAGAVKLQAALSDDPMRPDIVGFGANASTAPIVGVDNDGDFLPNRNITNDIGESTRAWKDIYARRLHLNGPNVKCAFWHGLPTQTYTSAGGNATGTGFTLSTRTMLEGPTTYTSVVIDQSSTAARNVTLYIASDVFSASIGLFSTSTLAGAATFYGYDNKGRFTSELIYFSTNHPAVYSTSTIQASTVTEVVRYVGVGDVAWLYVTSFTVQITSMTDAYGTANTRNPILKVGWGNRIGLPGDIDSETDVVKVMQAGGVDVTSQELNPDLSINPTWDTISFPTQPGSGVNDDRSVCVQARHTY